MKNLFKTIFFAAVTMTTATFASYASNVEEPVRGESAVILPDNAVNVVIDADVPEYYSLKIDVMINGIDFDLKHRDDLPNNGYTRTYPISDGIYDVTVFSNEDVYDEYTYEVEPKTLDTSKCQKVKIKVKPTGNFYEENEEDYIGEGQDIGPLVVEPEVIDLSDGQPYGTFHVSLERYEPAITSVKYSISSGTKIYDIELKRDYNFQADVLLPVGSYYERGMPEFELDEKASWLSGMTCAWSHRYNRGFFGSYYDIEEDGENWVNDLEIMMTYRNSVFPFNSNMLLDPWVQEQREAEIESHAQAIQESLNASVEETESETETDTESETIAELQPVENTSNDNWKIILAVVGVSLLGIASAAIYKNRKG